MAPALSSKTQGSENLEKRNIMALFFLGFKQNLAFPFDMNKGNKPQ
jgi:hypothetical protein